MKSSNQMTRSDFEALPAWSKGMPTTGRALVILPMRRRHDSGYRVMDFVLVTNDGPLCRLSGCSDVIHIDGIGGLGKDWLQKNAAVPATVPARGWAIDCLPTSGLLRLFCPSGVEVEAEAYSSFEIWATGGAK